MNTTKNLGLALNDTSSEDLSLSFLQWRQVINGSDGSNMVLIDEAVGELSEDTKQLDKRLEAIEGIRYYSADDFVNGHYVADTGIAASEYSLAAQTMLPVAAGDTVIIKPNGLYVQCRIWRTEDIGSENALVNLGYHTEDAEIVASHTGYLYAQVTDPAGQRITPDKYVCEIGCGVMQLDALESRIASVEDTIAAQKRLTVSPKHRLYTQIVNDCQDVSQWVITNNSADIAATDTVDYIMGTQSLRSDNKMRCTKNTYNLLTHDLVLKLRINSIATGASMYLRMGTTADPSVGVVYELMRGAVTTPVGEWREITVPYTGYSYGAFDQLDYSAVNDLTFYAASGAVDWNLQFVGVRPHALKKGIITFTFDDGYKSQYAGIKALAEKGITSTLFHVAEATDAGDDTLTLEQLKDLVNYYDADIEVHGDPSYDQWEPEALKAHWEESQRFLRENGLSEGKHMAYPNGMHPANVVQLARSYFKSCRTIQYYIPCESYPPADRYRIRSISSIGAAGNNVDYVKDKIDRAVQAGAWLILVYHRIGDGDTSMWCSEADLQEIADYAIASGAAIMSMAEVFDSGAML